MIWVSIPGYPEYMVSPQGEVLSINYNHTGKSRILKQANLNGYRRVCLCVSGAKKKLLVHRLVADVFCEKKGSVVNHIDANPSNNNYLNLEWTSQSGNIAHAYRVTKTKSNNGERNGGSKLTNKQAMEIKKSSLSLLELSKIYNVSVRTVKNCRENLSWKHININE